MPADRAVPILTYHSLDASGSVISVDPRDFAAHVATLARRGWRPIRLDALAAARRGEERLPSRALVLTFDDGFVSVLEHGLPILAEHGFVATLFALSGRTGGDNRWPGQSPGVPPLPLLDDEGLGRLAAAGWEIGSHGRHHPRLPALDDAALEDELAGSRADLAARLGVAPRTFAYPYGAAGPREVAAAARHYEAAVTVRMGRARPRDRLHALPRVDAYYLRNPRVLARLGTPAGDAWLGLRGAARAVRALLSRPGRG